MSTYRLFPATNGPGAPVSYAGNFLAGVLFKVTAGGMWLNGFYHWVPAGGDTVARKFALWNITGAGTGVLVAGSVVTSGTLTAAQWNFVALPTPVPLAIGTAYNAATGWAAVHGFPDSDTVGNGSAADSFGTGGHTAGITQGPLFAYSDGVAGGGSAGEPYGTRQGAFGTAGSDPSVTMPGSGSASGNFWMDVQVSDTAPASYGGPYRLWPNKSDTNPVTVPDAAVNYDVATEFALAQPCALSKVWYYSPPGTVQLATAATVWAVTGGGLTGTVAAQNSSPSWSGAAGSGWISCPVTGNLAAGKYKVSVYNSAASPDGWSAKDANTDYWRAGDGAAGITWGPLSAPNLAAASLAYNYNGSLSGSTPPFTDGTTLAGQPTFSQGPPDRYPYLYAPVPAPTSGSTQNYWVDIEVLTATAVTAGVAAVQAAAPGAVQAPAAAPGAAAVTAAAAAPGIATSSSSTAPAGAAAVRASAAAASPFLGLPITVSAAAAAVRASAPNAAPPSPIGTLTASDTRTGGPG